MRNVFRIHSLFAAIIMMAMVATGADAKYGGSSSSRSSSSSSSSRPSSPSPSYSRASYTPSSPSPAATRYAGSAVPKATASTTPAANRYAGSANSKTAPATPAAGRYGGSSDSKNATATTTPPRGSSSKTAAALQNNARENKAKTMYASQQAKFQKRPEPIRYSSSDRNFVNSARSYDSRTHYTRVNVYYTSHHYVPSPWIHVSYPYFGIYDATWLWFAWREAQHNREMAAFFYNHQNDDSVRQFRMEADRLGRENAELRAQNNAMNSQLTSMQGQPVNPNYAPAGVDKDIMLAQQALPDYNTQGVCSACHH